MTETKIPGWMVQLLTGSLAGALLVGVVSNVTGSATRGTMVGVLILIPLLLLGVHGLAQPLNRLRPAQVVGLVVGGLVVMLSGQVLILTTLPVTVYHDPFRIIAQAARLASGRPVWTTTYFWRYAQNAPVAILLSWWLRISFALGLSTNLALASLNLLMLDGLIVILVTTVWQISHRPAVTLGTLAVTSFTPFAYTYYLQVGYTDLPTLLVLVSLVRLVWAWGPGSHRQRWWLAGALIMVAALGQLIKGNLIVIVPASLLVLLGLGWSEKGVKRQLLAPLSLIIVGVLLAFPATTVIESGANFYHRHQIEFPLPAWIAMGYNQHTKGAFSTADVNRNLHQRTWQARQSNDWAVLKRRLTKPGLIKLSRLALAKLMILTNDANVNFWYNGGPRAAPAWYLQAAPRWEGLVVIIYQSVTGALYWLVSQRLLARQPGLTTVRGTVMVWLVLIALGYLTFHVFLWEVEERYGQVLLPLLLIMLALTRPPQPGAPRIKRQWGIAGLIVGLTWLSGVNVNRVGLNTNLKTVTVAAQRSQLSAQYGAKPWRLRPGQEVSQVINLHQAINYFSVQVHSGSPLVVTLEGPGRTVTLHRRGDCYRDRQPLPAGTYQVRINNPTPRAQPVDVTQVRHYQLAPQPLVWRGHPDRTASLIYDALWRIK